MGERGNKLNRLLDKVLGIPLVQLSACTRGIRRPLPANPQRVGIICLGAIGDLLLLSGLISGLRVRMPNAKLSLLTSRANASAVALLPDIDEHVAFSPREVHAILCWLRKRRFDVLVDSSQWARVSALLCSCSGAACTVGFATPGQYRSVGYSHRVAHSSERHEVENFLALGRALFADFEGQPCVRLPDEPAADALAFLPPEPQRTAYLHFWPSGIHAEHKEWPAEHWMLLAGELARNGFAIRLTGSPEDAPRNEAFLREYGQALPDALSLAGKVSLPSLAWLLARAQAVISVNTGIMHLAALTGTPTVALHGATNPLRWGPLGERTISLLPRKGRMAYLHLGFEYPPDVTSAMQHLPPEDVLAALHTLRVL